MNGKSVIIDHSGASRHGSPLSGLGRSLDRLCVCVFRNYITPRLMSLHPSVVHSGRHQLSLRRVVHRGTYWYGTVSVRFDHHVLSGSPASIASAELDHLGRLADQCELDIPYQAHVHHHHHHLRTCRVWRPPRSHL